MEEKAGICCITKLGCITDENEHSEPTLHYRCLKTQAEFYATVSQIVQWIDEGPLLPPPDLDHATPISAAPVTYPTFAPVHTQRNTDTPASHAHDGTPKPITHTDAIPSLASVDNEIEGPNLHAPAIELRRSLRKRKAPDFLRPKFKGKAYTALHTSHLPRKERVPITWAYVGKQRVSQPEVKIQRLLKMKDKSDI
jgi:hypothetical protein